MTSQNHTNFEYKNALKQNERPSMKKINFVDLYLNRPLASLIVRLVFNTSITPNGLTYFSCLLGLGGALSYIGGDYKYFILGGILLQLSSIVDGADGMLARAKKMGSEYGAHLDLIFDRIIDFLGIVGLSLGASYYYKNPNLAIIGILTAGLYLLQIHLFYLTKSYLKINNTGDTGEARAILYWGIMILSILNRLDICIFALLAETVITNIIRLIIFLRLSTKQAT